MFYERELNFLINIFKKCNIPIMAFDPEDISGKGVTARIRNILNIDAAKAVFSDMISQADERTFYKMTDVFGCHYMFLKLPEKPDESILFIGPYINEETSPEMILEQAEGAGFTAQKASQLDKYYRDIIVLSEDSRLFAALDAFCDVIWGDEGYSYININTIDDPAFPSLTLLKEVLEAKDPVLDMEMMEKRYAAENQLMEAVTKGQTYKAEIFMNAFSPSAFEQRLPDTLRNAKNYMIIMNTLLRKAAEKGGVHPIYLNKMSSGFAKEIESINMVKVVPALMKKMFEAYCRLVNKHATGNYSILVKNVIICIDSDLTADLSLRRLAEINGVSASYLSTCFKQETGKNYVDYVNAKRIDMAKHLLKTTKLQIQTVAQHCGFLDMQYFSKVFKKYTKKTPRQYRDML